MKDNGVTGNFEVSIDGVLAHSKKTRRDGFPETNPEKMQAIFSAIEGKLYEGE